MIFDNKIIGMCSAYRLAAIRILIISTALFYVLWEQLSTFSEVPVSWYRPIGFMMFFPVGLMQEMLASASLLTLFKMTLTLFLLLALIGCRTRLSLLVAVPLYLIFISIPRAYAWFFHTGLVPFYLMFFMLWLPVGDALSVDSFLGRSRNTRGSETQQKNYAWSVFLLRAVLAGCYFQAGYAKLHNSGLEWFAPWNLKHFILESSLTIMHFDTRIGMVTLGWPDWLWVILSIAAVFSELLYPIVLFSWQIRMIYPIVGMGLHGVILALQNIFFPDLIILQMIFYDWDRLLNLQRFPWHDRRGARRRPKIPRAKAA